jgi:hypothetical protein
VLAIYVSGIRVIEYGYDYNRIRGISKCIRTYPPDTLDYAEYTRLRRIHSITPNTLDYAKALVQAQ